MKGESRYPAEKQNCSQLPDLHTLPLATYRTLPSSSTRGLTDEFKGDLFFFPSADIRSSLLGKLPDTCDEQLDTEAAASTDGSQILRRTGASYNTSGSQLFKGNPNSGPRRYSLVIQRNAKLLAFGHGRNTLPVVHLHKLMVRRCNTHGMTETDIMTVKG